MHLLLYMKMKPNDKIIEKWLNGTLTEAERNDLIASGELDKLERLDRAVKAFKAPQYPVQEELERALDGSDNDTRVLPLYQHLWKVAAVLVIVMAGVFLYIQQRTDLVTVVALKGKELHYLPDSSKVWLNIGASIAYAEKNWQNNRKVKLEGEAFFLVQEGSKFDVESNQGMVTVLGTEFNIRDWDDYYEVVCYEGKVRVGTSADTVQLTAGDQVRYVDAKLSQKITAGSGSAPSWIESGKSSFQEVPFHLVLKALERQYGVKIKGGKDTDQELFTGMFPHDDLKLALDAVLIPAGYIYNIKNDEVILKRE